MCDSVYVWNTMIYPIYKSIGINFWSNTPIHQKQNERQKYPMILSFVTYKYE